MAREKQDKVDVREHQIWVGSKQHRRVCGVIGEKVRYSRGGEHLLTCKLDTFRRWIKRDNASRADRSAVYGL